MNDLNARIAEKFKDKRFEKEYHRTASLYRLADRLLLLRRQRNLTQKELAQKIGTTQAVVSRLENASVPPSLETILNFAEALEAVVDIHIIPIEDTRPKSDRKEKVSWENLLINIPEIDASTREGYPQTYDYFEFKLPESNEVNGIPSEQLLPSPRKIFELTK
jgi:transcriptional regulator with XRE-family HTH domain